MFIHQSKGLLNGNSLRAKMRHVELFGTHDLLLHDIDLLDEQHILLQHSNI